MLKKIAVVTRNMSSGGAERVLAQLVKYFDDINMECIIITINDTNIYYDIPDRVKIIKIGKKANNTIIDRILRYKAVREIALENKVDIVLSMPEEIGIYVIPAMILTNIPVVVSERNNPWVMPDSKITRMLRRIFYPIVDGLIFQTETASEFFSEKIRNKGIVLGNPLDLDRIPDVYLGERKKTIVSAGRIEPQKNYKLLVEAFAEFYKNNKDYTLIIYGEGNLVDELRELSINRGIPEENFLLPGRSLNLLEDIKDAGMFVLSSDYEGMPNVLIEALVTGIPSISTDCPSGGPGMLINNNENGVLIPVNDKNALIDAMEKVKEKEFADKISKNALKLKKELGSEEIYKKWYNYLEKISKKK